MSLAIAIRTAWKKRAIYLASHENTTQERANSLPWSLKKGREKGTSLRTAKDVAPFAQITIVPLKTNDYTELGYTLAAENNTLSGSIAKSEYGEYVAEITLDFVPTTVTVAAGEETSEIDLASVLDGALAPEDIINIAKAEFKDTLDKEATTGREREIYLKVITGDRENYYFYVSFIGDGVDYLAVLIDPKTGKIVSKK